MEPFLYLNQVLVEKLEDMKEFQVDVYQMEDSLDATLKT